jgi:hypothetical protein
MLRRSSAEAEGRMMHPTDLPRIYANDNRPNRYDESEGLDEWMRETRQSLFCGLSYVLFAIALIIGCIIAFRAAHAAGGAL